MHVSWIWIWIQGYGYKTLLMDTIRTTRRNKNGSALSTISSMRVASTQASSSSHYTRNDEFIIHCLPLLGLRHRLTSFGQFCIGGGVHSFSSSSIRFSHARKSSNSRWKSSITNASNKPPIIRHCVEGTSSRRSIPSCETTLLVVSLFDLSCNDQRWISHYFSCPYSCSRPRGHRVSQYPISSPAL